MAGGGVAQALKRIPRIKFPQRHPAPSGYGLQSKEASENAHLTFFSGSNVSKSVGGRASDQPKRTPVSNEEIEAILVALLCCVLVIIMMWVIH